VAISWTTRGAGRDGAGAEDGEVEVSRRACILTGSLAALRVWEMICRALL